MSTSTSTMTSPPITNAKSDKTKKHKKVIILRLSSKVLAQFAPQPAAKDTKSPPSSESTLDAVIEDRPTSKKNDSSTDNPSEANSTPAPPIDGATPTEPPPKKRKGPMPGFKRGPTALGTDGLPKPRGKPGPKKKPRLEDGTIDHSGSRPSIGANPGVAAHKLGPKANQGAINAGLRALDRTGKPCRRWDRKAFQVKSFTGVVWGIASWKAPLQPVFDSIDGDSEMNDISQQSSSDIKPNDSSTAMESNSGEQPDQMAMSTPAASSPIPITPALAVSG